MTPDAARRAAGYLTAAELVEALPEVRILDPASTIVSPAVRVAAGAVLYPGVVLRSCGGRLDVAAGAELWPGTRITVGPTPASRSAASACSTAPRSGPIGPDRGCGWVPTAG